EPRRLLDLVPRQLQPDLRRLVDRLEQQLVAVHPLVGSLLERKQRVRAEIALVVGPALARQHRLCELGHARSDPWKMRSGRSASGTPSSRVTSHVSCMYRHACPSSEIACGCIENTIPSRSSVSSPSPIFGHSIIVIPIECPVT